ncbi:MAG: hypothetical protein H6Q72_2385 [Firmicutes bacterium]|nr:hypothetical protein [Bacillota bacterium]
MKRTRRSLILCLILMLYLIITADAKSSLPYGFKGLIWGQTLDDFQENKTMKDVSTSLGNKVLGKDESAYKRLNNDNKIGGVDFANFIYIFWHGKFSAISAYTQGSDKFTQIVGSTQKKFGRPNYIEENQYCKRIVWTNSKAETVITMAGDDDVVHFYMRSRSIEKLQSRWEKTNKPINHVEW